MKTKLNAKQIVAKLQRDAKEEFNRMADLKFEYDRHEQQTAEWKAIYFLSNTRYAYIMQLLNYLKGEKQ